MLESIESRGIVLYHRDYREDDKLVKIFTEQAGKLMFFVKHANRSRLNSMIQPLTLADMYLKINDDGLSYIEDIHEVQSFQVINQDLFRLSYATYILALADASIQDRQPDPAYRDRNIQEGGTLIWLWIKTKQEEKRQICHSRSARPFYHPGCSDHPAHLCHISGKL